MKKRIFSLVLALMMLMNIVALMPTANAATFSDVPDNHWAKSYIEQMQGSNIINGYEDGTFKHEKEVKVGEFIKILCVKVFPDFKYIPPEDGSNWSRPYVEALDGVLLKARDYNDAIVSRAITREEAAKLICYFHVLVDGSKQEEFTLGKNEEYIKNFSDESLITNSTSRMLIDNCVRFGLINGFEDGTFRPNATLTRAQASKMVYTAIYNR